MEPYQKNLLEQIVKQGEENNKILKSLRGNARWGVFFGFLKWAIILGPIIWAYIYFQPYLGTIKDLLQKFPEQVKTIQGLNEQLKNVPTNVDSLLKNFPKIQ
ncbi:MAG: hypothetical protein AAB513_00480 [Patescibacteria group bacterium]